jgi:hypothetical protein
LEHDMTVILKNNAFGFLAASISASDTTTILTTGTGANFPSLSAGEYFYATIAPTAGVSEIVKCTGRSGDTLTIIRAQEGTSALSFAAGSRVELRVTAQSVIDAITDRIAGNDQASEISFTPTGGVSATNVQTAIAEVDSEKISFTRLDDSDGAGLSGYTKGVTNTIATTVQAKLREHVSVKDFGAVGNGVVDDTTAIQNAINYISQTNSGTPVRGGGTVYFPPGTYRITSGLLLGWGTRLLGDSGTGYPYSATGNAGQNQPSVIEADFGTNVNQWIIDSATYYLSGPNIGQRVAYNAYLPDQIDGLYNSNHKVAIANLDIRCADVTTNIVYGGIRLIGCPNASLTQFTLSGTGIGLEMQTCFLSTVTEFQLHPQYYGLIFWNANNNSVISGTTDRYFGTTTPTIPVGRIPSIMPSAAACTLYGIDTSHATTDKGICVMGSFPTIGSNMLEVNITAQYWTDSAFHFGTTATLYKGLYTEADSVRFVVTSVYSSLTIESASWFCTNAAAYGFDVGFDSRIDARLNGLAIVSGGLFKSVSDNIDASNRTHVILRGQWQNSVGFNRVSREDRSKALAFVAFDGTTLAINNSYNIIQVIRTPGEAIGDYFVDFYPDYKGAAYNITNFAVPQVSVSDNDPTIPVVWFGGGDGMQSGRVRVRTMNTAGAPVNPDRVYVTLHM